MGSTITALEDEWEDVQWLQATAQNPAFEFLHDPQEDIYSLEDGRPFSSNNDFVNYSN